jgi:amidase
MASLKGVFHSEVPGFAIDSATVQTFEAAADAVREISHLERRTPPGIEKGSSLGDALMRADDGEWVWRGLRSAGTEVPGSGLQTWLNGPMPHRSMKEYVELVGEWDAFRLEMTAFFEPYDFIIGPVATTAAQSHDAGPEISTSFTFAYNLTGWPAVVVRGGTADDGMPIGVQVVAKPWKEDIALAVASWIEARLGGWKPPTI